MKKNYSSILFIAISILAGSKGFSQGAGDHLTMSIDSCTFVSPTDLRFNLMVVSDGASTSDLRASSFNYGVNYQTCMLPSGATIAPSYVPGSTDFPQLAQFNFLFTAKPEIRIEQTAFSGANTGITMVVNHKYKVGTFDLFSSANYTTCCPNFMLQADTGNISGRTFSATVAWVGNTTSAMTFFILGTGTGKISLQNNCSCPNGINENSSDELISFFPNPAADFLTINTSETKSTVEIKIIGLLGELKYFSELKGEDAKVDISKLAAGIYFIEASSGNLVRRYQFIKE